MHGKWHGLLAIIAVVSLSATVRAAKPISENSFLQGYVTAVLQVQFHLTPQKVIVRHGRVVVYLPVLKARETQQIHRALVGIENVRWVQILPETAMTGSLPHTSAPANSSSNAFGPSLVPGESAGAVVGAAHGGSSASLPDQVSLGNVPAPLPNLYRLPTGLFPPGLLFAPLLADPRWPGFSAEYEHFSPYHPISGLKDVIQVSIGDTIPIERFNLPDGWQFETGMQATVFAFFNMDTSHSDLQNADYFVGGYGAFRHKNFSMLIRYYHQSSHLGDELLIDNPQYMQLRQKISYEELNAIVSLDLYHRMFRIYAGGGYLGDVAPSNLKHWRIHYGAEFHGPMLMRVGTLRLSPIAGADFKNWDQTNWDTEVSLRAGFQIERNRLTSPKMQFLLEFYNGYDPNGQFFTQKVQYIGFGVHYYF